MSELNNTLGNDCIVRREWHTDSMAIWFCQRDGNNRFATAKPLQLEFVKEEPGGFFQLPEPTLILPGRAIKEFYEALSHQLEMNGERFLEARSTIKAQDANLADLRKIVDRAFNILEARP